MSRWATFDCYGTLVDWNAGIRAELERVLPGDPGELLHRYHELEPQVQARDPALAYRRVMAEVLAAIADERGIEVPASDRDALGRSLPSWPVFAEAPGELAELRREGWKLAILTNSDRDLIDASIEAIGVPFELTVVASEIGSYKPAERHWRVFFEETGADPGAHVHVAQSRFHDIEPAHALGLRSIWVNRLGEHGDSRATREIPDLAGLATVAGTLLP